MAKKKLVKKSFYSYIFSKYDYILVILGIIVVLVAGLLLWYFLVSSRGVYSEGDIASKDAIIINMPVTASPPNNVTTVSGNATLAATEALTSTISWFLPISILLIIVSRVIQALYKKED